MYNLISLLCLVVGVVLLIYGISSADRIASRMSRFVSGHPDDRTMWMLVVGTVCSLVGLVGLVRGRKT